MLAGRRHVLMAGAAALLVAGCGFELKRPPQLGSQRIQLRGFDVRSSMAEALRRQLRASSGVRVVETAAEADLILEALIDRREQVAAASTAIGLVTELTLRSRLRFIVRNAAGVAQTPETELLLSRDMGYSESTATAKELESEMLYRAMEADIATQVLRRLASLGS